MGAGKSRPERAEWVERGKNKEEQGSHGRDHRSSHEIDSERDSEASGESIDEVRYKTFEQEVNKVFEKFREKNEELGQEGLHKFKVALRTGKLEAFKSWRPDAREEFILELVENSSKISKTTFLEAAFGALKKCERTLACFYSLFDLQDLFATKSGFVTLAPEKELRAMSRRDLEEFMDSLVESLRGELIKKAERIVRSLYARDDNQDLKKKYQEQLLQEQRELNQAENQSQIIEIVAGDLNLEQQKVVKGLSGLFDLDDCKQLKQDLFISAQCPRDPLKKKTMLDDNDDSTWTWQNLDRLTRGQTEEEIRSGVQRLLRLQAHAGSNYVRTINSPIRLLKVSECTNISPFLDFLNPQDKHDLTHSAGNRVCFNLDTKAFDKGNIYNSVKCLKTLKQDLLSQECKWLFQQLKGADQLVYPSKLLTDEKCKTFLSETFAKEIKEACTNAEEGLEEDEFVRIVLEHRRYIELIASPIHSVTLPPEARLKASIPQEAHFYAFCYPLLATEFESNLNLDVSVVSPPTDRESKARKTLILNLKLDLTTSFETIEKNQEKLRRDFADLLNLEENLEYIDFTLSLEEIETVKHHKNSLDSNIFAVPSVAAWMRNESSHVKIMVMYHSWKSSKGNYLVPGLRFQILKKLFAADDSKNMEIGLTKSRLHEIFGQYLDMPYRNCDDMRKSCNELLKMSGEDQSEMDWRDPFCNWLLNGGFVYFDHKYDIVAINAIYLGEMESKTSVLYIGASSTLPHTAINSLDEGKRWVSVTDKRFRSQGFTHFAWICPSEFVGDHIYTQSGGFAFRHEQWEQSVYCPVVRKAIFDEKSKALGPGNYIFHNAQKKFTPAQYNAPLHIVELTSLRHKLQKALPAQMGKFVSDSLPEQALFSEGAGAALGILFAIGITESERSEVLRDAQSCLQKILDEIKVAADDEGNKWVSAEDVANAEYVISKDAEEKLMTGNDGRETTRDKGHNGYNLDYFHDHSYARTAQLHKYEVAALRLYTTSTFRAINGPLRAKQNPHPLKFTTYFIYEGLKKLRAVHLSGNNKFRSRFLWRGMKDRTVHEDFLRMGGTELACMSTSEELSVVAGYANSATPLLFRIRVDSPMELGANIQWLSTFPDEQEVLYPPLTFLKPMYKQEIKVKVRPLASADGSFA